MNAWPTTSVERLCSRVTSGGTPSRSKPEYYSPGEHLWVKSKELLDGSVSTTEELISDAGLRGSSAKPIRPNTVLMAMYGANVGQLGWLKVPATVNQAICAMETDPELTHGRWLFYSLMHWRPALTAKAHGAAQQNLSQGLIREFEVPAPPLPVQRKIAAVLGSYDELIENNLRRIRILEEMAQAVYREWFVNFRYPGHENVPLVDSPLGPIPKGWGLQPLFEVADVGFGFAFKSKNFGDWGRFKVVRIRDIPTGDSFTFTSEEAEDRYRVRDDDVLIGMDGDFHMCIWAAGDAWLNQRVTRVRPKLDLPVGYLYEALRQPIREFNEAIVGTTVAHLGKRHLENIRLIAPPSLVVDAMQSIFDPITGMLRNLKRQIRNLRATRDLLLPRLVSGEIDISDLDIDTEWLAS